MKPSEVQISNRAHSAISHMVSPKERVAFYLMLLGSLLFFGLAFPSCCPGMFDPSMYFSGAVSLREGQGYVLSEFEGNPAVPFFPPGQSMWLAIWLHLLPPGGYYGDHFIMKVAGICAALFCLAAVWTFLIRKGIPCEAILLCFVFIIPTPIFSQVVFYKQTDTLFVGLIYCALQLIWEKPNYVKALLAGTFMGWVVMLRPAGWPLVPFFALHIILAVDKQMRFKMAFCHLLPIACSVGVIRAFSSDISIIDYAATICGADYLAFLGRKLLFWASGWPITDSISVIFTRLPSSNFASQHPAYAIPLFLARLLGAAFAWTAIVYAIRGYRASKLTWPKPILYGFGVYILQLFLYPQMDGVERYFYPCLPLLLIACWNGFKNSHVRPTAWLGIAIVLVFLPLAVAANISLAKRWFQPREILARDYANMIQFIKSNTLPQDMILTDWSMDNLRIARLTGRKLYNNPFMASAVSRMAVPLPCEDQLRKANRVYALLGLSDRLRPDVKARKVYASSNGELSVYEIVRKD